MEPVNYYQKRITELKAFQHKANSKTSALLIGQAIAISEKAWLENLNVGQMTAERVKFYDEKKSEFDNIYRTMLQELGKIKDAPGNDFFSPDTKQKILAAWEAMSREGKEQYDKRILANRALREAIWFCGLELNKTLTEFIFKPASKDFLADSIFDFLKAIVHKLVPFSGDIEDIFNLSVAGRKKYYLSKGDKFLIYLEDYISVLNTWLVLSGQFRTELLD